MFNITGSKVVLMSAIIFILLTEHKSIEQNRVSTMTPEHKITTIPSQTHITIYPLNQTQVN